VRVHALTSVLLLVRVDNGRITVGSRQLSALVNNSDSTYTWYDNITESLLSTFVVIRVTVFVCGSTIIP
jgi:hypothetical protein